MPTAALKRKAINPEVSDVRVGQPIWMATIRELARGGHLVGQAADGRADGPILGRLFPRPKSMPSRGAARREREWHNDPETVLTFSLGGCALHFALGLAAPAALFWVIV